MQWSKPVIGPGCKEAYAQLSADGRYSVTRIGTGKGFAYEAWATRAHKDGSHCIAVNLKSSAEGRQKCEEYDAN